MATTNPEMRATMNCGLLPVERRVGGSVWGSQHGLDLETCAGYTTRLPDVIDIASQFSHYEHGALSTVCGGDPLPQALLDGLAQLTAARRDREWREHKKQVDASKGGR
jgi:hypothetical protein